MGDKPVYSTGAGDMRQGSGKKSAYVKSSGPAKMRLETKGRGGKAVTVVRGVTLDAAAVAALGKRLRTACGSGGTVKDGTIEVQGDHCERVMDALRKEGWVVKRAGG